MLISSDCPGLKTGILSALKSATAVFMVEYLMIIPNDTNARVIKVVVFLCWSQDLVQTHRRKRKPASPSKARYVPRSPSAEPGDQLYQYKELIHVQYLRTSPSIGRPTFCNNDATIVALRKEADMPDQAEPLQEAILFSEDSDIVSIAEGLHCTLMG